jgi:Transglutaminase-like superfamily
MALILLDYYSREMNRCLRKILDRRSGSYIFVVFGVMRPLIHKKKVLFLVYLLWFLFCACGLGQSAENHELDWPRIVKLKPELKVLALLESERPLNLKDLSLLADQGLVPADRDPGLALGLKRLVFSTTLQRWMAHPHLPSHFTGRLLLRFSITGIYRVGFSVAADGYRGPLTLRITAPREGFGRHLIYSDHVVRPRCETSLREDEAGNLWLEATYPEVKQGDPIKFHFAFKYIVDMKEVLARDLALAEKSMEVDIPADVKPFLGSGRKIDPNLPQAVQWAARGMPGPPDARHEYTRLTKSLSKLVRYDKPKKYSYFGGMAVYSDLDHMYQEISTTLTSRKGCCTDTVLLECAFLRARGIPCRTAGRFGHFFSLVYLPGRGWMSTSVTPTEIPLIVSPGPDHVPYQNWTPRIPLRTTRWEARIRIEDVEE